jgi:hypothetical protein
VQRRPPMGIVLLPAQLIPGQARGDGPRAREYHGPMAPFFPSLRSPHPYHDLGVAQARMEELPQICPDLFSIGESNMDRWRVGINRWGVVRGAKQPTCRTNVAGNRDFGCE